MTTEQRVTAGMAWLDTTVPGWERSIDLATLDITDGCNCVLGQAVQDMAVAAGVYPEYCGRVDAYEWAVGRFHLNPGRLGFLLPFTGWDALEETWRVAIKGRFDTGVLSDSCSD